MEKRTYKYHNLTWEEVLSGYSAGIFPMGNDDGSISWFETNPRSILPIEYPSNKIHVTRSLSQVLKRNEFKIKTDTKFDSVIKLCSSRPARTSNLDDDEKSTWINKVIIKAYTELFNKGYAHSVETWFKDKLVGGLYGVAYKGAFFGESMFYLESNALKCAVVKLYEILKRNKFILLDIQMMTPHFKSFGAIEISKRAYLEILDRAMGADREFKV